MPDILNICHLISGDRFGGIATHLRMILTLMQQRENVRHSAIVFNEGEVADSLVETGALVRVLNEKRIPFCQMRGRVIQMLASLNTHIIHSHRYKQNILAAWCKGPAGVAHIVQTVHGLHEIRGGITGLKSRAFDATNTFVTRKYFDAIIPVSNDLRSTLVTKNKYPSAKMTVIPNALDINRVHIHHDRATVRATLGLDNETTAILAIGRLVHVKAFDVLIEAVSRLRSSIKKIRLFIAGDGPLRAQLEAQRNSLDLQDQISFLGFRNDILDLLHASDIFVLSSRHEGIPMTLLEAMALGLPIIATKVGGVQEVIIHDESGIVIPPNNSHEIARACERIISNTRFGRALGTKATERLKREYSGSVFCERLCKLYEMVSGSRNIAPSRSNA
jgi:glycosyltransferase involved in cell wall biosynthesis